MVIGIITTAIRIGQIAYRIATIQNKAIRDSWRYYPSQIREGVVYGAGFGAFVGSVIEYFSNEEQGGNIVGIQAPVRKGGNNRQYKTRNKIFKTFRSRRCAPRNSNRSRQKYSGYR